MRFDCDYFKKRRRAKDLALREWTPMFALLPNKVAEGDCRWLETVEYRRVPVHSRWPTAVDSIGGYDEEVRSVSR